MGDLSSALTGYPGAVDTWTNQTNDAVPGDLSGDTIDADHVNGPASAILAIESELGVNPAGSAATVVARLDAGLNADGAVLVDGGDVGTDQIVFGGASGALDDDANFTWTGTHLRVGTAGDTYTRYHFAGNFTSGGASTQAFGFVNEGTITGANGDTDAIVGMYGGCHIATQGNSETIAVASQLYLDIPTVTINTGDTVTNACTLYIEGAPATGSNQYAILVDAGNVRVDGTGPHSFGGTDLDYRQFMVTGSFTSGGAAAVASKFLVDGALTGASGDTTYLTVADFDGSVTTQGGSETITTVAQVRINEPQITEAGGSSVTNSASLYITGAASEGTNNYALWVDAGDSRFDGNLDIQGTGPHALCGGSSLDYVRTRFTGSFTSGGASTALYGTSFDGALTGVTGDTVLQTGTLFTNSITTQASDTITMVSQVTIDEPNISVGGGATVSAAASLYISGAPSEGVSNYALWVDAGDVRFDGVAGIGADISASSQLNIAGTYSPDAGAAGSSIDINGTINGAVGANVHPLLVRPTIQEAASGTHSLITAGGFFAPTITAGAAATTDASTLYVDAAPTGGTSNYAFWVDAGNTRLDGVLLMNHNETTSTAAGDMVMPNGGDLRFVNNAGTDTVAMFSSNSSDQLLINPSTGTMQVVTRGAADTGDVGFRVLQVPN